MNKFHKIKKGQIPKKSDREDCREIRVFTNYIKHLIRNLCHKGKHKSRSFH